MKGRKRERQRKRKSGRGGSGEERSNDRLAWFFSIVDRHYRRSSRRITLVSCHTLIFAITSRRPRASIFTKKLSTGTDRPLRAFGPIDVEGVRGREKRDLVNFISLLVYFDPRDRLEYHSMISACIGEVNSSIVTTLHQIALLVYFTLICSFYSFMSWRPLSLALRNSPSPTYFF